MASPGLRPGKGDDGLVVADLVGSKAGAALGQVVHGVDKVGGNLGVLDGCRLTDLGKEFLVLDNLFDHGSPSKVDRIRESLD